MFGDGLLGRLAESAEPWLLTRVGRPPGDAVEQLHLSWGADAAREVVVSWHTPDEVPAPFVEIDGSRRIPARSVRTSGTNSWSHHANVTPLDPNTDLEYVVGYGGRVRSLPEVVRTAPVGPVPFTFTAFGDHGTDRPAPGTPPTYDARRTIALVEALDPAFHLVAGDLSYANGHPRVWDRWLRMIETSARRRPWMACVGNHEVERSTTEGGFASPADARGGLGYDAFTDRFPLPPHGVPGEAATFGTFRYAGVRFVLLDNNDVSAEFPVNRGHTGGTQGAWLDRTLAAARADPSVELIVVVMHHPAFSSARGHGSDLGVRDAWHRLFVEHEVTLVLQGHDHLYERTQRLAGSARHPRIAADGVTYLTCGTGGFAQVDAADGRKPGWSAVRDARHAGVVRVTVEPATSEHPAALTVSFHPVDAPHEPTDVVTLDGPTARTRRSEPVNAGTPAPPRAP